MILITNWGTFHSNLNKKKKYIKQFLLSFSPPDFNDFVLKSIGDKLTSEPTTCIISICEKYLKV